MTTMTTWTATVEANHTIRVPTELSVGERVLIAKMPSLATLLADPERRKRFAATRAALRQAIDEGFPRHTPSNEEIVALVKRARKASAEN
ncbi:MAG: hypothetical protein R3A44_16220 [Caldilineaceae bacterium]